jgi:GT2 family glycosyltransferase
MTPLVTIGIPCFNNGQWLRQAVESALAQTWPAVEVIVVDDGSTDDSRAVVRVFGDRIRPCTTDHLGAPHARNQALAQARGEWVQFLDADDYLEPEKIAQQFAETNGGAGADVIYSPVLIETVTDSGATRETSDTDPDRDLHAQWIAWQIPQTGGCLWRKAALDALGGWKPGQLCCQEHELYLRALQAGLRFAYAPTPHAVYRIWSEQTLCRRDPRLVIRERTKLIDNLQAWLAGRSEWTATHRRIAGQACFEMARTIAKYDLAEAAAYHRERRARGLLHLGGPAAPTGYRLAHRMLGFTAAEKLAAARR